MDQATSLQSVVQIKHLVAAFTPGARTGVDSSGLATRMTSSHQSSYSLAKMRGSPRSAAAGISQSVSQRRLTRSMYGVTTDIKVSRSRPPSTSKSLQSRSSVIRSSSRTSTALRRIVWLCQIRMRCTFGVNL